MRNTLYKFTSLLLMAASTHVHAQGLRITSGAHLVVNGAPQLVLSDAGLINDGEVTADSSSFRFTGNMPFIGGGRPIAFYDLIIGSNTQLNNHASVTSRIFMQGGNLQLNGYTLDLGRNGSIVGESNSAYISGGLIKATALLDAPRELNPGNIGIAFTSEANLGWTTVTRGHEQQTDADILRYFNFEPEKNGTSPVSCRLFYLDGELTGKSTSRLAVLTRGAPAGEWTSWGRDQADPVAGWVTKRNVSGLHQITLGIPAGNARAIRIAPNPTPGQFRVTVVCTQEGDKLVSFYDALGHILKTKLVHCIAGSNTIEWDGTGLASGIYRLNIEGMESVTVEIMH